MNYIVSLGGDGKLLNKFWDVRHLYDSPQAILPIRNYANCDAHTPEKIVALHKEGKLNSKCFSLLENSIAKDLALSEITIRNRNMTSAIRMSLHINGILYARNIIGDGLVICTPLGATGYFRSVTRTIFKDGIGIGFLNTTQSVSHLVLPSIDSIRVTLDRGDADMAIDNHYETTTISEGTSIEIKMSDETQVIIGYAEFMCQECREKRHGAVVNEIYNTLKE